MTEGISFTKLVKAARGMNGECAECNGDGCPYLIDGWCDQDKIGADAAEALEALLQTCAEWTAKYEEARDRCNLAEKQLFFMENLVRCGECKYWHEVDTVEGTNYGECKRPHPIIRKHIFLNSGWYCADGERKGCESDENND